MITGSKGNSDRFFDQQRETLHFGLKRMLSSTPKARCLTVRPRAENPSRRIAWGGSMSSFVKASAQFGDDGKSYCPALLDMDAVHV